MAEHALHTSVLEFGQSFRKNPLRPYEGRQVPRLSRIAHLYLLSHALKDHHPHSPTRALLNVSRQAFCQCDLSTPNCIRLGAAEDRGRMDT